MKEILTPTLIVAEILFGAALFLTSFVLAKLRKQMAEEIGETRPSEPMKHPWRIYRRYTSLHPQSILSRCYTFLSISSLLLAIGIGVIGFCFGKVSAL